MMLVGKRVMMGAIGFGSWDGMVGHQWEERFLVLSRLNVPVLKNIREGKWEGVGDWVMEHTQRSRGWSGICSWRGIEEMG